MPISAAAVQRRRTFAIISHPDAGKTTLTEKLLLYGGAIHLAGAVKARRTQRHVTSDWMAMERERGISITSSVMQFEYLGYQLNLLDTPGHEDFSEDTYRTLTAADSAVMVLDNRKGVEERTRQLFRVCQKRRTPMFTFVNKCDRAGEDPLTLISDVETDLGIACYPVTWPIVRDGTFIGVCDRRDRRVHLFERDSSHGSAASAAQSGPLDEIAIQTILTEPVLARLSHDLALLDEAGHAFSEDDVRSGELTPVFFGSALTNFGVEAFLRTFLEPAPPPQPRESSIGLVAPLSDVFSAFVFKIQANMDTRHRDRIAFLRVCSGKFEAGMPVTLARTGRSIRLAAPQQFLARERSAVAEAWAGDIIGVMDRGTLRIGDTVSSGRSLEFADLPRFPPEHFARAVPADALRRKQFDKGLRELSEEGAAQVFHWRAGGSPEPVVGAVGRLQFDVMQFRLEHEYGAPCRFEPLQHGYPRWVTGPADDVARVRSMPGRMTIYDRRGNPIVLFRDEYALGWALRNSPGVTFHETEPE